MKLKIKYFLILLFILAYTTFNAQDNLENYLIIAAENNPGLKAKYEKYLADLEKVPQIGTLPNPDISLGYFIKPMEVLNGNQRAELQFMQMFPWFGTLKAAKDEASAMAWSSFELFRAEKENLFFNIKVNYYQLFLIEKQIHVYDTTLALLKSMEQILLIKSGNLNSGNANPVNTENMAGNGNVSPGSNSMNMGAKKTATNQQNATTQMSNQTMTSNRSVFSDLLEVQVELKELENIRALLKNRKQMIIIQLNSLLNRNTEMSIFIPENLITPSINYHNPALFDSIKAHHPMIRMNKNDIIAYQQQQKMNKKMGYPMIGIGLNYMIIDKSNMSISGMNGENMIMPMLSFQIPIYRKKINASIREAKYLENSANEQLSETANMLYMEFSEYQYALSDAERKLSTYRDIISITQKNFDLLLVRFSTSDVDFGSLIRLHRQLLDYKLIISQAQVDKLTAIAGIQKLLSKN